MRDESGSGAFGKLSDQFSAMIDDMLGRPYTRYCSVNAWQPELNLYEGEDAYLVCVDLSGMKQEHFDVNVQSNVLIIRGSRPRPLPPRPAGRLSVHMMEINSGDFCREVQIPSKVRQEAIDAEYRDGLLWIKLPKINEAPGG